MIQLGGILLFMLFLALAFMKIGKLLFFQSFHHNIYMLSLLSQNFMAVEELVLALMYSSYNCGNLFPVVYEILWMNKANLR